MGSPLEEALAQHMAQSPCYMRPRPHKSLEAYGTKAGAEGVRTLPMARSTVRNWWAFARCAGRGRPWCATRLDTPMCARAT